MVQFRTTPVKNKCYNKYINKGNTKPHTNTNLGRDLPREWRIIMKKTTFVAGKAAPRFVDDNHVLGIVKAGDTLPEDGIQPVGERGRNLLDGSCIAIGAQRCQLLDNPQFLDITGDGCLRSAKTFCLQFSKELFLGFNVLIGNDF